MTQEHFTPQIEWTKDGWYKMADDAEKQAMQRRNTRAKELKAQGLEVSKGSRRNQLLSFGGIGSGKPHIEVICTCYYLNYRQPSRW